MQAVTDVLLLNFIHTFHLKHFLKYLAHLFIYTYICRKITVNFVNVQNLFRIFVIKKFSEQRTLTFLSMAVDCANVFQARRYGYHGSQDKAYTRVL